MAKEYPFEMVMVSIIDCIIYYKVLKNNILNWFKTPFFNSTLTAFTSLFTVTCLKKYSSAIYLLKTSRIDLDGIH